MELPKFKATTPWEKKLGVLWLRFLNEITTMTEIPAEFVAVPELCKALELAQEASYTKGELEAYEKYWDTVSTERTVRVDAFVEGKAEGKAEGIAEGEFNAKRAMALTMLNENCPDEMILKFSKLTSDELTGIKSCGITLNFTH